jgi:hypothetical protein
MAMECITAEVGRMDDELLQFRLTKLKELYDRGFIGEAMYYQNQCEIFENLLRKDTQSGSRKCAGERLSVTRSVYDETRLLIRKAYSRHR